MEDQIQTQTQPIQNEISDLLTELKSNNLNGNEIIQVQKQEIDELKASLINVRDQLLDMLTRGDNDKSTTTENTAV